MLHLPRDSVVGSMDFVDSVLNGYGDGMECDEFGESTAIEKPDLRYKSKNLETERKRRNKLKQMLYSLRALVPNITKMSKESTLTDAIDYVKQLQKQVVDLQKEISEIPDDKCKKQAIASSTETIAPPEIAECQGSVKVNPISPNKFHVEIFCENKRDKFTEVVQAMNNLGLEVSNVSYVAFSAVSQSMFWVEGRDDRLIAVNELRDILLRIARESISNRDW